MTKYITFALIIIATLTSRAMAGGDTAFTYQGRLLDAGAPANGTFNVDFSLWDDPVAGSQIGSSIMFNSLPISDGLFTVELDFGASAFDNTSRWIEISVNGTELSPRQPVTRSPYSIQTRGIFVDDNGKVGIGTATPGAEGLHVVGDGIGTIMRLTNGGGGGGTALNVGEVGGSGRAASFYGITTNDLISVWNDGSGKAAAFRGDVTFNQGRVGIGTISPSYPLHVLSASGAANDSGIYGVMTNTSPGSFSAAVRGEHQSTTGNGIGVWGSHAGSWGVYGSTSSGRGVYGYASGSGIGVYGLTNSSTGFAGYFVGGRNYFSGNVGIGIFSTFFKLAVNGNAGKPGGGSWSSFSDRRLKKNIHDLRGSLEALLSLRGVNFEYIDPEAINELPGERIGMIAQEVEEVFPEWVDQDEDGYRFVTFRGFEALTVEALRELREEKDRQLAERDAQIASLRAEKDAEIAGLHDRLATLEAAMERMLEAN